MTGLKVLLPLTLVALQSTLGVTQSRFTNSWVAQIVGGADRADQIAKRHGFQLVRSIPQFEDHYELKRTDVARRSKRSSRHHTWRLTDDTEVLWAEQQVAKSRVKRTSDVSRNNSFRFDDPDLIKQWYIVGNASSAGHTVSSGSTMRVEGAWRQGYSGLGVVVTVVDDGLEHSSDELSANYDPQASADMTDDDPDPSPHYDHDNVNRHGTRCAGVIAMEANNSVCGVGVAYKSNIGGIRMLDGEVTDIIEAKSLSFHTTYIDIYSASWGPDDDGTTVDKPGTLTTKALENGIKNGRDGKGSIYVWASGNGGYLADNCNCDGYTSSVYTLSVSSATEHGRAPWYGERCSSTLTTTYSSGSDGDRQVVSADIHNKCTSNHTGTSASAPMAAGIIALMLEANPSLTWRDVQHLIAITSLAEPLKTEKGWYKNGIGLCVNSAFGFGLMDAEELVTLAQPRRWEHVPKVSLCEVRPANTSDLPLQVRSGHVVEMLIDTDGCAGQDNEVNYLEHVEFITTITYSRRGALTISVISPSGTETEVLGARTWDNSAKGFYKWSFMSVHTWGEHPAGVWKFRVHDQTKWGSNRGELQDVRMVLHGTKLAPDYRQTYHFQCDLEISPNSAENSTLATASKGNTSAVHQVVKNVSDRRKVEGH